MKKFEILFNSLLADLAPEITMRIYDFVAKWRHRYFCSFFFYETELCELIGRVLFPGAILEGIERFNKLLETIHLLKATKLAYILSQQQ